MGTVTEIELKARVGDHAACKKRLETAAGGRSAAFAKDDAYWKAENAGPGAIRIRLETKQGVQTCFVTWKRKTMRDRIEVNDEKEFSVSDPRVFEELLSVLGFEKGTVKHKEGWAWTAGEINAELCEVSGSVPGFSQNASSIGWFLELEILAGDSKAATLAGARNKLFSFLEQAGLGEAAIETRYYTELISEACS